MTRQFPRIPIIGYCHPLSVRPGEIIGFKVSCSTTVLYVLIRVSFSCIKSLDRCFMVSLFTNVLLGVGIEKEVDWLFINPSDNSALSFTN